MSIPDLDYCFINPNLFDFRADTLRKAIVKLHRLNAACHTSPDDWAQNLIEATKDLRDPQAQEQFYTYLANPSGFSENTELWDALEAWDKQNIDKQVVREVTHDVFNPDLFEHDQRVIGNTVYIAIENKEARERGKQLDLERAEEKEKRRIAYEERQKQFLLEAINEVESICPQMPALEEYDELDELEEKIADFE